METQILQLNGKQGSGKDTTASIVTELFRHEAGTIVQHISFAQPIRDIHTWIRENINEHGIPTPDAVKIKDGDLMQLLGLWGRKRYSENLWLDIANSQMKSTQKSYASLGIQKTLFIITDCRFKNEFEYFPQALRVRLECARSVRKERAEMWRENELHDSEIDLDDYVTEGRFDLIYNTQTQSAQFVAEAIKEHLDRKEWMNARHPIMK